MPKYSHLDFHKQKNTADPFEVGGAFYIDVVIERHIR